MESVLDAMEKNLKKARGILHGSASNKACCLQVLRNTKPTDAIDKEHDRQNSKFFLA